METLLVPFQYEYMLKAILVSGLVGLVCSLLSCFVTLKGWSLMGDALSHSVVPGVALAYLMKLPFAAGAFSTGMLAALGMAFVKSKTRLREDAVMGVVFTSFFAAGLLIVSIFPMQVDARTIVLGNMLGISDGDMWQMVAVALAAMLILALRWKDLLLYCFDPNQARAIGLNVRSLHLLLIGLLSATTVAALQAIGAVLVAAMLITPGATAYLLTDRFGRMLAIAAAAGVTTSLAGAYASYFFDGSTGGCIVTLQSTVFLAALIFAPKHGMLANRRNRRLDQETLA